MGVTIYEHSNYGGKSSTEIYYGPQEGMPCWPNWDYNPACANNGGCCGGWHNAVSSIKFDPENAYEWCGWGGKNQTKTHRCYELNTPQVLDNDWYESRRVRKKCDHHMHRWDGDCYTPSPNQNIVVGTCNPNTDCWINQRSECNTADLRTNGTCKNWCATYPNECPTSITNYCNNLGNSNIDQMADDNFCKTYSAGGGITHSDRIKADKCVNNANLFPTNACTTYCTNEPTKCLRSLQTYCENNMDQACQNFCKDNRIEHCTAAIKNHCFKNNNANMSSEYCKTAVRHKFITSPFDDEMREYCNVLPDKPGSGSGRQRDLSKMVISTTPGKTASDIDNTLENPICSCFDEQLIKKKFSNVKQANAKDAFVTNPQCFLANCKNDPKAYKKKEPNDGCKITMCIIDADAINIVKSSDVKIENNCGPGAASITNGVPGTPGTPGANTPGADAPSTSTTTTTGTTTKDCKKTKCVTLEEQIKNKYFNYNDLNDNNKNIFVGLICLLIFLLFFIIYMV